MPFKCDLQRYTVRSMRRWAVVCCVAPYYVAVVEIALGEVGRCRLKQVDP